MTREGLPRCMYFIVYRHPSQYNINMTVFHVSACIIDLYSVCEMVHSYYGHVRQVRA